MTRWADRAAPGLRVLPCPLRSQRHDLPGVYLSVVGHPGGGTWEGARLRLSRDSGGSWLSMGNQKTSATVGAARTVLGDCNDPWQWDEVNTVTIRLPGATLSSATSDAAVQRFDENAALLGDELIGYRTVVDNADGTYTLSGLIRGRRGTEWATSSHALGEAFTLLDAAIVFRRLGEDDLDETLRFAATSHVRRTGSRSRWIDAVVGMRHLDPYAPVHVAGSRDGSNDLTITWTRRSRYGEGNLDGFELPLAETSEAYEIDILDGSTVVRTIEVTEATATYTASQQTSDGLTPGDPVDIVVYQMSSVVGRGHGAEATV